MKTKNKSDFQIYQLEKNTLGDLCEYHVALEAAKRGAKVYKNISCVGYADLILEIDNRFIPIDVKARFWSEQTNSFRSKLNTARCQAVCVEPDDKNGWKISWPLKHGGKTNEHLNCPEGLEAFWE